MSLCTGAKKVFSPSSVVEYARFPAKTWKGEDEAMRVRIWVQYLETGCFFDERVLHSRRHAVFSDKGGLGIGHFERDELMERWGR